MLDKALKNVAVAGAAGKMGSGISLLLLQEMAASGALQAGHPESGGRLHLIDSREEALEGLHDYLKDQLVKYAEKNIVTLRQWFKSRDDLVENGEMVAAFVEGALSLVRFKTGPEGLTEAALVFEAVVEDSEIKVALLKKLKASVSPEAFFLTNTSSVPISLLDERADLKNRIIGFHFYNPPAVQKLVEIIVPRSVAPGLVPLAQELGRRLKKTLVAANDVAGFIGNGHFLRDALFGLSLAEKLKAGGRDAEAVYLVNRVSQDFMVRPMGIFQLMDYVGIDVCQSILKIMAYHLPDPSLHSPWIDAMISKGVRGGQFADGSQKDGFLRYDNGKPAAAFSLSDNRYLPLAENGWSKTADGRLGPIPEGHFPWKALVKDLGRDLKLKIYFKNLFAASTLGSTLAQKYLTNSREIARKLVDSGVAVTLKDVNAVLMNGFFHLYGPENDLF